MKKLIPLAALLAVLPFASANAQDVLTQLMTSYRQVATQAIGAMTAPLLATFLGLTTIALAVQLAQDGISGLSERWLATGVNYILSVGLGIWLINNAGNFSHLILQTMGYLAGLVDARAISPTSIFHQGIAASHKAQDAADAAGWHFGSAIVLGIAGLVVLGCFVVIAAAIVVQTVEFYLVSAIVLVMLPLIGLPWTRDSGYSYYYSLLRTAVGVLATGVIAIVAFKFTDTWLRTVNATNNVMQWDDLGLLLGQSATLAYCVVRVPQTCMRAVGSPSTMTGMGLFANTTYMARSSVNTVMSAARGAGNIAGAAGSSARSLASPPPSTPSSGSGSASLGSRFSGGARP